MKLNRIITLCAVAAALVLTAGTAMAQNGGGGGGGNGGGGGGGRGGRGNFDPAAMMQRYMDRLGFTNDTDAAAVQPLVQKVLDARMAMGGGFGGRGGRGGGGGGGNGGPNAQTNPDRQALQDAIDNDAPSAQIKELLTKYQTSQKAKQATLTAAQEDLRKVLNSKQEAQATLMGLLN